MVNEADGGSGGPDPSTQKPVTDFEHNQANVVHANLSDINNYALYLSATRTNVTLAGATSVGQVTTGLIQSVKPGASGITYELATMSNAMSQHASDFKNFFADLSNGIYNIANAAQVISDSYGGTDGLNSANIDGVDFAFADPTGKRPAGLSKDLGQTVSAYNEQQAQKNGTDAMSLQVDPDHPDVGAVSSTGNPYIQTFTYADGSVITVESVGGGTVTTFYGPSTSAGAYGPVLGTQKSNTTYGSGNATSRTVTDLGPDGTQTQSTTTSTNADGSTDITVSTGPDGKNTTTQHIDPSQSTSDQQNDPMKNDPLAKTQQELKSPGTGEYGQIPG